MTIIAILDNVILCYSDIQYHERTPHTYKPLINDNHYTSKCGAGFLPGHASLAYFFFLGKCSSENSVGMETSADEWSHGPIVGKGLIGCSVLLSVGLATGGAVDLDNHIDCCIDRK